MFVPGNAMVMKMEDDWDLNICMPTGRDRKSVAKPEMTHSGSTSPTGCGEGHHTGDIGVTEPREGDMLMAAVAERKAAGAEEEDEELI